MGKKNECVTEGYLEKIFQQNESIIDLLKIIASNTAPTTPTKDDESASIIAGFESLTKRERQVIELVMQGMMNKQMAYELSLSLSTIEAHRSSVMKKMDAKNVAELTRKYMTYQSLRNF